MGLYESKLTGEPSFIIKALGANWLLHLEKASIDAFLEDRIGFEEILKNSKLSKLGHKKTGFLYKTLFKWWTSYFIVGKLSQQKKSVPYPNVFYFYQQIKLFKGWNG
jgi:hypothetical protein